MTRFHHFYHWIVLHGGYIPHFLHIFIHGLTSKLGCGGQCHHKHWHAGVVGMMVSFALATSPDDPFPFWSLHLLHCSVWQTSDKGVLDFTGAHSMRVLPHGTGWVQSVQTQTHQRRMKKTTIREKASQEWIRKPCQRWWQFDLELNKTLQEVEVPRNSVQNRKSSSGHCSEGNDYKKWKSQCPQPAVCLHSWSLSHQEEREVGTAEETSRVVLTCDCQEIRALTISAEYRQLHSQTAQTKIWTEVKYIL